MGFRSLRVINDDRVQPGQGFGMHSHRDVTTPPREQGGFLGQPPLRLGTGFPAARPTGPVRAGRFREREQIQALTACRMSRPPAPSGCAGCGVPGRRRFEHCTTGWCRGLLTFLYFIIGGRRFLCA